MAMTPFEGMNHAIKVLGEGGAYAALKNIEDALKKLQIPSIEGITLLAIGKNENITHDNQGNILVEVGSLKDQVQIGTMFLRANEAESRLERSLDGVTWHDISTATGVGDMTKAIYDITNNGRVDKAEQLFDGTNTATPAEIRNHLDNHPIGGQEDTDGLPEGVTNLYYTEARVAANADVAANTSHRNNSAIHGKPTVAGTPMLALHQNNLVALGGGEYEIKPNMLNEIVNIDGIYLKKEAEKLSVSYDLMNNWQALTGEKTHAEIDAFMNRTPVSHIAQAMPYTIPNDSNFHIVQPAVADDSLYLPVAADSPDAAVLVLGLGIGWTYLYTQGTDLILNSTDGNSMTNVLSFDGRTAMSHVLLKSIPSLNAWAVVAINPDQGLTETIETLSYSQRTALQISTNTNLEWVSMDMEITATDALTLTLYSIGDMQKNDVMVIDRSGSGIIIACNAANTGDIVPGNKSSISNAGSPAAYDFVHFRCVGNNGGKWMIVNSRGTWS
jgi:predicted RNA-binding protein